MLGTEIVVAFIKHFQGLRRLRSEGRPPRQALEHDRSQTPQIRFGVVLERHDHLWGLDTSNNPPKMAKKERISQKKEKKKEKKKERKDGLELEMIPLPCTWENRRGWRP